MVFSQEIINVLDYLCGKFGIAIDWTSENVMPYLESLCEKYIKYEIFTSIAWIVIISVITAIIAIILFIMHKKANSVNWDSYHHEAVCVIVVILWVVFVFMALTSVFVVCTQVLDIIECKAFPEKTILEYLKQLMNNVK